MLQAMTPFASDHAPSRSIAIAGGGLSGAALALALLARQERDDAEPLDIHVFEPAEKLGGGVAYGPGAAPWHLLNVVAARAALDADRPDDFWQWARLHGPALGWPDMTSAHAKSYLPRRLLGLYVETRLAEAQRRVQTARLLHHRQRLIAAAPLAAGGFAVKAADGKQFAVKALVLATGAPGEGMPELPGFKAAREAGRLLASPWNQEYLSALPEKAEILILGTALTMADTVLSLRRLGKSGRIHALSRHGLLPPSRRNPDPTPPAIDTESRPLRVSALLQQVRRATAVAGDWQAVFEGLRPVTHDLWQILPGTEKLRFTRHFRSFWDVHRFRMPPSTAAELAAERESGGLVIHSGRLIDITTQDDGLLWRYRPRGGDAIVAYRAAVVIPCLGLRGEGAREDSVLTDLEKRGLLRGDITGAGFDATRDGVLLDAEGREVPGLFTLGPPMRGVLLDAMAVLDIGKQAQKLAQALTDRPA